MCIHDYYAHIYIHIYICIYIYNKYLYIHIYDITNVRNTQLHTQLRALDLSANALGTGGLIYALPALTMNRKKTSPLTHLGLEKNGLCFGSMQALSKVMPSLGNLQVLALAGNRLPFDSRHPSAGGAEVEERDAFILALTTHCRALRYLDFAPSSAVASTNSPKKSVIYPPVPNHPRHAATAFGKGVQGEGGGLEGGSNDLDDVVRVTYATGAVGGGSGKGNGDGGTNGGTRGGKSGVQGGGSMREAAGALTLGALLWATEVLEQWRTLYLAFAAHHGGGGSAGYASQSGYSEWEAEGVRVLQSLLAHRDVTHADLRGVVAESKLGRALSRAAALALSKGGHGGGGGLVAVLAGVLKSKWGTLLEQ